MALQHGRGGFLRSGNGAPYVTDPSGALNKQGEPKRLCYGSPSGFGESIGDPQGIVNYGGQRAVLGFARDTQLWWDAHAISDMDPEDPAFKSEATRIFRAAKTTGGDGLSAERGTLFHDMVDTAFREGGFFDTRPFEQQGEALGFPLVAQLALLDVWWDMLNVNGLELLLTEQSVVNDRYRKAGTLDAIVRATRDLTFVRNGEAGIIYAGTVLVLDLKTGKLRVKNGNILYWRSYPIQIHCYASSVPYNTVTEKRSDWEWPINQDHGLIAHLDVAGAIRGEPKATLVYVDLGLAAGAAQLCIDADRWESRTDMFAFPQVVEGISQLAA